MQRFRLAILMILVTALALVIALPFTLTGQNETIITIALPSWMTDTFNNDLFQPFLEQNPGVKVVVIPEDDGYFTPPAYDLEGHFESAEAYTSKADVLFFQSNSVTPITTRAGYLLDLSPLIESDPEMNPSDFFPAIWQSYQWDRGIWAIPVSAGIQLLTYNKTAFDEAGVAYPTENWTFYDLIDAATALTTYDENGEPEIPGISYLDMGALIYGATGEGFYDETQLPSPPDFSNPQIAELIDAWQVFQSETQPQGGFDYNAVPMQTNGVWILDNGGFGGDNADWDATLLPGGVASLYIQGFGISAGTEYPEMAYELVKFLSYDVVAVSRIFGDVPARQSLVGVEPEEVLFFRTPLSEKAQAILDLAIANAVPASELRYSDYLTASNMFAEGEAVDPATALEEAEQAALDALAQADEKRASLQLFVATPVPTPSFSSDQVLIRFGLMSGTSEQPNRNLWESTIRQFVQDNPRVGNVDVVTPLFGPNGRSEVDCYYTYYNELAGPTIDTSSYLSLDPFLDADPNFDPNSILGDSLQRVQIDGRIYGYPVAIQPSILWYDSVQFADANLVSPEGGWTIEAFIDALLSLQALGDNDDPVFSPQTFSANYILMLVAAYGAIPYDRSTDPATFNLTDPATIDAIRQVLDLARDGYIDYRQLSQFGGSGALFGSGETPPISTDVLNGFSWRYQNRQQGENFYADFRLTHYPRGSRYIPMSYDLGTAYISSETLNPEVCYQFISTIANVPGLFTGVPANRAMIDDPNVALSEGEDVANLYVEFADSLTQSNVLIFPGDYSPSGTSFGSFLEPQWMYEAFDNYVMDNVELETALTQAQENIATYRQCASGIEEQDITQFEEDQDAMFAYYRQFLDCGIAITPELREQYQFFYEDQE